MDKHISELKARGAVNLGNGAMLKVLLISLELAVVAFIIVGLAM